MRPPMSARLTSTLGYLACQKAGITKPRFEQWAGDPAKLPEEIASRKLLRDHMTTSQLAAVAVRHQTAFGEGALDRQKAGSKAKVNLAANLQQGPGRTLVKAAYFFGAKPRLCYALSAEPRRTSRTSTASCCLKRRR